MKKQLLLGGLSALTLVSGSYGQVIPNFSAANLALGQPSLTATSINSPVTAASLRMPRGVVVDATSRKVFVADTDNNRVLRYSSAAALNSGASAEAVFGQGTFSGATLNSPSVSLGMQKPSGIFFDSQSRLWVADTYNHRVLMFSNALTSVNQPTPSKVLGQADLTTTTEPLTAAANKLIFPSGIWVEANDRLWVVDGFNRVLRFDAVTGKANGANADGVLGQPNFTTGIPRNTDATTIRTFNTGGSSLAVSASGTLFVAASLENRVLRFSNAGTLANNSAATSVLGQPNFTTSTNSLAVSARSINGNDGFSLTLAPNDSLWVSDTGSNRVLRFDMASTKANGANADGVLGQPDFISRVAVKGDTNKRLFGPRGLYFDGVGALWVADASNNRVVRFALSAPPTPPSETIKPVLTLGKFVKSTKAAMVTVQGTASDVSGIKEVSYRVGMGPVKVAMGTTKWSFKAALKKGVNKVTVFATDTKGNVSLNKVVTIKRR